MPPKEDSNKNEQTLPGFDARETKMLAAAYLATTGIDKYDYELFGTLTGYTVGSAKKMFPPVKKKAIEAHPSFAAYLGGTTPNGANGEDKKVAAKAPGSRKRKATSEPTETDPVKEEGDGKMNGKKKAPAKGRGRAGKKAKPQEDDVKEEPREDSAGVAEANGIEADALEEV